MLQPLIKKEQTSFQELTHIAQELMKTAGPGMINNCALYSSSFVCGLFISQLGIEYIAAISYANRFRWIFMTIPSYLFLATQSSLKKAFNKTSDNDIPPSLIITAALLLSIPIMAISMILLSQSKNILTLLGQNAEDAHLVNEYFKYFMAAVPPYILIQIIPQIFYASPNRRLWVIPLSLCRSSMDILLTFFLKERLGFIAWPIASSIQNWATFLTLAALFLSSAGENLRKEIDFKVFSHNELFSQCATLFKIGIPIVLQNFVLALGGMFLTLFVGMKLSQESLAAFGIVGSVAYWAAMLCEPFATGSCLLISENDKQTEDLAKRKIYAGKVYGVSNIIAVAFNLPLILTMIFGYRQLASLYLNPSDSQEELDILSTLLPIYSTMGLFLPFKSTATGLLRGKDKNNDTFYVELFCSWGIALAGGAFFTFSQEKSVIGVGASEVAGTAVAALLLSIAAYRKISKKQSTIKDNMWCCWQRKSEDDSEQTSRASSGYNLKNFAQA